MQLQLNINDFKANIFLELLEVFKKDNLVEDYKILNKYNEYENEIINDLQDLHLSMKDDGYKTDKFIEISNLKWNFKLLKNTLSKSYKKLSKHYKNINNDVDNFLNSINSKDDLGIEIKSNIFKVRIKNSDKNKGKSAGYRLISYLTIVENQLQLLYIYDKSEIENLTENEIDKLIIEQTNKWKI